MGIWFVLLVNKQGRRGWRSTTSTSPSTSAAPSRARSSASASPAPTSRSPGFVLTPNQERRFFGSGSGWAVVGLDFHVRLTGTLCQCSALSWSTGTTRSSTGATPPSSSSSAWTTMSSFLLRTKPDARVKLIPAQDITYVRHGKPFGRTVGSAKLQKRHSRRSVTPPPSSRKVSLAKSTPLTHKSTPPFTSKAMPPLNHKASAPFSHKATASLNHTTMAPLTHKAAAPPTHKPTTPPLPGSSCLSPKRVETAHKATGPLSPKPTTSPLPVASCLSPKRVETAENRQPFSLNRPSPLYKAVQRGAFPPSVSRKESEMNPINPSSVHVPPAYSRKVPLDRKAEPSSKSVSTLDNKKLCSTSNQAALRCQPTKRDADPIVEKENTVKLPLLSPTSVLSSSSTEVCPDNGSRSASRLNLFDKKCKLDSPQPETNIPQAKSPESTTPAPYAQLSNDLRVVSSTKIIVRNERQTNQEPSITCNISSATELLHFCSWLSLIRHLLMLR